MIAQTYAAYAASINDALSPARDTLLDPNAENLSIMQACNDLEASPHSQDIRAVSEARNLLWASRGSEVKRRPKQPDIPIWDFAPARPSHVRDTFDDESVDKTAMALLILCVSAIFGIGFIAGVSAALARQAGLL